eukprot:symbB.v1.2.013702.t1/scaffold974.1/size359025/9
MQRHWFLVPLLLVVPVTSRSIGSKRLRHAASKAAHKGSPFLDDLEPIAPLDAVGTAGNGHEIVDAGIPRQGGARRPALYVPPYLYPDAFPSTASDRCRCEAPKKEELTKEDKLWAREVAKQLGLPLAQVMEPRDFRGVAHCDCGNAPTAGQVFRYVKSTAENSSVFTLEGADPTFPFGSYWEPEVVNSAGLVAPGDALQKHQFPLQAPFDEVDQDKEIYAKHDRIPLKYARYFDQLESRLPECQDCTSACTAGDQVLFQLGNLQRNATVVLAAGANAAQIEFLTGLEGGACPVEAGCSMLRVCTSQNPSSGWQSGSDEVHLYCEASKALDALTETSLFEG